MYPRFVLCAIIILTGLCTITAEHANAADSGRSARAFARDAESVDYRPDAEECAFVALINQFRADNGKGPLSLLRSLGAAADHKSDDMATRNYFGHTEPPSEPGGGTTSFSQNITDFGYTGSGRGENIAAGYASAQATFNQWERSEPHRRNMLGEDVDFQAMGIGRAYDADSDYGWYWTNTFGSTVIGDIVSC